MRLPLFTIPPHLPIITIFALLLALSAVPVRAASSFVVNSLADSGDGACNVSECNLREAIAAANSDPDISFIHFNIPGTGLHTIRPTAPLPIITAPATFDGTTQPGYAGVPLIELDGSLAGGANGLAITGGSSTVRGLLINRFSFAGIFLAFAGANTIVGNIIGTDADGTIPLGNRDGVYIYNSPDNIIGGTNATDRNLFSGNNDDGINLEGVTTTGNRVIGNWIGAGSDGQRPLGNLGDGVKISAEPSGNSIGGVLPGEGNVIAFNGGRGVYLETGLTNIANAIQGNRIFNNAGTGIDLNGDGPTANDSGDSDTGPNHLQNAPQLTTATVSAGKLTLVGQINSLPSASFRLEFFSNPLCDTSSYGEGGLYLGALTIVTDSAGDASFSLLLPVVASSGSVITAIATGPDGSTSEFSACQSLAGDAPHRGYTPSRSPVLSWNRVTSAIGYHLQLDDNPAFTSPWLDQSSLSSDTLSIPVNPPLPAPGVYYWRVRARLASGLSPWSATESLTVSA